MARIMALDVGSRTIGVAVSDESETYAFPRQTLLRHQSFQQDAAALMEIIRKEGIEEIVIGLPLNMDGTRGFQVENVERFAENLRRHVQLPLHFEDERLTTFEAESRMLEEPRRRSHRKHWVDALAAKVILEEFLHRRRLSASS